MRLTIAASFLTAIALAADGTAESKFDPTRLADAVAPFVGETTFVVAHADLGRLDPDLLLRRVAAVSGMEPKALAGGFTEHDRERYNALMKAGVRDVFVVLAVSDVMSDGPVVVVPLPEGAEAKVIEEDLRWRLGGTVEHVGAALVAGQERAVARLRKLKPAVRPELADAFAAAGDGAIQLAFLVPSDGRRVLEELLPTLPPALGGGSVQTYTQGIRWAGLGLQTTPRAGLRLTIASPSAAAARDLHAGLDRLLHAVARQAGDRELKAAADKAIPRLLPKVAGDRLELVLDEKAVADMVRPVVPRVRGQAARAQSMNNLKQLALALFNYHDAYGRFPPSASRDKGGKPLLSWRVLILPFIEGDALYKEFHLDEPWDSDHNKKLISRMPRVYDSTQDPRLAAQGKTTYLGAAGKSMMFPPGKDGLRITDVTDGTSNTIFLVDADDGHAVVWTKPQDLDVDLEDPAKGLSTRFGEGYLAAFADGSVHFLKRNIDKATLRALFTRNGGEVVNIP
jgi:hypothetical protein